MKRGIIISVLVIFLIGFISALSFSPYENFNGWKIRSITGNESVLFNVNINGNQVCVSPKQLTPIVKQECSSEMQLLKGDLKEVEVCKDVSYSLDQYKTNLPLYDWKKKLLLQNLKTTFSLSKTQMCVTLNPFVSLFYKLGLESIIIEGETSYDSTDTNITQETGFAHLNISDPNLVLYMPFDVNTSGTTYDYTNNSNDGTITNALFTDSGYIGGAYYFDGAGDFIEVTDSASLDMTDAITISAWIYPLVATVDMTTGQFIVEKGEPDEYELFFNANTDKLVFEIGTTACQSIPLLANQWYHIVGAWNGTHTTIYINNNLEKTCDRVYTITPDNTNLFIGKNSDTSSNFFNGTIDELMIFNKGLTSSEVSDLYNNQSSRFMNGGNMLFQNLNFSINNTINITIDDCQTLLNTNLSARINNGNEVNFTNCQINDYSMEGNLTSANLTILFQPNTSLFYSPIIIGNITLDSFFIGDTTPPIFTTIPNNESITYETVWGGVLFVGTDETEFDTYFIDDTTNFIINSTGFLNWTGQLAVGEYYINVSINDTSNNINSTIYNLNVTKFVTSLGISGTTPITYGATTNVAGSGCPSQISCSLDKTNEVYGVGTETFNYSTSGNENYTSDFITKDIIINKATLSASITNDRADTFTYDGTPANIGISESNTGDGDVTYKIYADNSDEGSSYSQASAGIYSLILNTTGGANYSSSVSLDTKTLTINQNTEVVYTLFNESSPINYPNSFRVFSNATSSFILYRNGSVISNNSIQGLGAGAYNFTTIRTDQSNYSNVYDEEIFVVNQNTENCNVLFNETSPVNQSTNFKVFTDCNSAFTLYRNGSVISNNSAHNLIVGAYNFTVIRTDQTNYSNIFDEEIFVVNPRNVSVRHFTFEITEATISSTTNVLLFNGTVELTTAEHLIIQGDGGLIGTTGGFVSTNIQIDINGNTIIDEIVGSVSGNKDRKQFTITMNDTNALAGTNIITIWGRNSNTKAVTIRNLDIFVDTDVTNDGDEVRHLHNASSFTFSNTNFVSVANFTFNKTNFNSSSILDFKTSLSTTGTDTVPEMYLQNNITGETTIISINHISTNTETKSGGFNLFTEKSQGIESWNLFVRSPDGDTITVDTTLFISELTNDKGNIINGFQNKTTVLGVSGTNQLILQNTYTIKNDSEINIMATYIAESTTGVQQGSSSPVFFVNSSNSSINCLKSYERSFSGSSEPGVIKMYVNCNGVIAGETYTFFMYVNTSGAETLNILNASLSGDEIEKLDITTGIIPPIPVFTNPLNGTAINGNQDLNITVTDISDLGWGSNITLLNISTQALISIIYTDGIENTTGTFFDTTSVSDGDYTLVWLVNNSAGTNQNNKINITIDNTPPTFDEFPTQQNLLDNESLSYEINATDINFDSYAINWSSDFTIGVSTGVITNTSLLQVGLFTINITINDTAGNENYTTFDVNVSSSADTTAPTINIQSPTNITYGSATNTIFFNATTNEAIDTFILNYNGTNVTGFTINTSITVEDGMFQLLIYANDSSGNMGLNDSIYFSVDTTPPVLTVFEPTNKTYNTSTIQLNASATDNVMGVDTFFYSLDGASNITFTPNITLFNLGWEANHTLRVYVNDTGNNLATVVRNFEMRSEDAIITSTGCDSGEFLDGDGNCINLNLNNPQFSNLVNQTTIVNESFSFDLDATGSFLNSFSINDTSVFIINSSTGVIINNTPLINISVYVLNVTINNSFGEIDIGILFINVTLDIFAPNVTINSPTNSIFSNANINVNISISENGSCIYSTNGGTTNISLTNQDNRTFTGSINLANNFYTINAYCNDTKGNNNNTESINFKVNVQGSGGSSAPPETKEITIEVCEELYKGILSNQYIEDMLEDVKEELKDRTDETFSINFLRLVENSWQGFCSDKINRTLKPDVVCDKIFNFVLEKDYDYTNVDLINLEDDIDKEVAISKDLIINYIDDNKELCVRKGHSETLPRRTFSLVEITKKEILECKLDVPFPFYFNIGFPDVFIGDRSCGAIVFMKFFVDLEKTELGGLWIKQVRLWWILSIILIILSYRKRYWVDERIKKILRGQN